MKLALYTIFRCTNYGAVLQALALSRVLRERFGESSVEVLNHFMDPRDTHLRGKISNPATPWFQRYLNRRKFARRYHKVEDFEFRRAKTIELIDSVIRPTTRIYKNPKEFAELPAYDLVIVGSDQIWNPTLNLDFGYNPYMMDTFPVDQARASYAASLGVSSLPETSKAAYKISLERFCDITCREESGAEICEQVLGRRPEVVLDPTLLLPESAWRDLIDKRIERIPRGEIAAYWVRTITDADLRGLSKLAEQYKCRVRLMSAGPMPKLAIPEGIDLIIDADPLDFVAEIASSSRVVTESFHGMQFSTIFRRPFAAFADLGAAASGASRLVDFATRYRLSGGIGDIADFRLGKTVEFALFDDFDETRFVSDRNRSLSALFNLGKSSHPT